MLEFMVYERVCQLEPELLIYTIQSSILPQQRNQTTLDLLHIVLHTQCIRVCVKNRGLKKTSRILLMWVSKQFNLQVPKHT
jgi:hypothetical protein